MENICNEAEDEVYPDGDLRAGEILDRYDQLKPPAGYPMLRRPAAHAKITQPGERRWFFLEPTRRYSAKQQQFELNREVQTRRQALYRPRYGWIYPAYTRFIGMQYPENFPMMYGAGPRSDHYYPGLTPKDVMLAKSKKRKTTTPGYMAPRLLRNHEITGARKTLDAVTSVLYEGYLPTNNEVLDMIDTFFQVAENYARTKNLSEVSYMVLEDLANIAILIRQFILECNDDEKVQRLVHHSILSARIAADQRRRAQKRRETLLGIEQPEEFTEETRGMGLRFVNIVLSLRFRRTMMEIVQLIREMSSGDIGQGNIAYNMQQPYIMPQPEYHDYRGPSEIYADGGDRYFTETPSPDMHYGEEYMQETEYARPTRAAPVPSMEGEMGYEGVRMPKTRSFVDQNNRVWEETVYGPQSQTAGMMRTETMPPSRYAIGRHIERDYASILAQPLPADKSYQLMDRLRQIFLELKSEPGIVTTIGMMVNAIADLGRVQVEQREYMTGFESSILYHDSNRRDMMDEIAALIQVLSGGQDVNELIDTVDEFQIAFSQDWMFRNYISELGSWLRKCLEDPYYLESGDFLPKSVDMLQRGRLLLGRRYPVLVNRLLNGIFAVFEGFRNNPLLNDLAFAVEKAYEDLLVDPQTGKITVKASLLHDIRNVYLPIVMKTMRYIPLPRIEFSDANYDFALDNVVLVAENIIPSLVEFKIENQVQVSPRPDLPDAYFMNLITLDILQIQTDVRNVEFAYRKKSFPRIQDSGLADVILGGNGLSIHLKIAYDPNLWYTTLIPIDIDCSIDALTITPHETGRDTLYKIMAPAVVAAVKKRLCRSIEESLFNIITRLDEIITCCSEQGGKKKVVGIPLF